MATNAVANDRDNRHASVSDQEDLLQSLLAINLEFLLVMSEFARASYCVLESLGELTPLFLQMTPELAAQASRFPFLLLDLQFSNATWWSTGAFAKSPAVKDVGSSPLQVPKRAVSVTRSALTLAWHSVRMDQDAALVHLGLSPSAADAIGSMTLHDMEAVALAEQTRIRPRWATSVSLWKQLLSPRHVNQVDASRDFVLHALQLTASAHMK